MGRNYRKQKIFSRKSLKDFQNLENYVTNQLLNLKNNTILHDPKIEQKIGIINLLINNNKALLTEHNQVTILNNGDQTFASIIDEIQKAEHHIHLEYYIIDDDIIGNQIRELLIEKSKQGVKIRIIYDGFGSRGLGAEYIGSLLRAGIEIYSFMPVRFYRLTTKINFRNHRKIVIVDGKVGFVGGLNIADRYLGNKELGFWRDTHLRIEGDAVKSLQAVFLIDWQFVSDEFINSTEYFPECSIDQKCLVQIASSGPDSDWASIMQAYFYAIASASKYMFISMPYIIPNESILTALKTSALAGVDIRLILPFKSDSMLTYWSSLSYLDELLESGIKVYMYEKGFTHSKLIICDDIFASVGTANLDIRSFDQNLEVNALIYDEKIAITLKNMYLEDLSNCFEITADDFSKRSSVNRFKESLARVFSPIL